MIERLERIERLRAAHASRATLLLEIRALLAEGEAWVAAEPAGTDAARAALARCRRAVPDAPDTPVARAV